MEPLSQVWMHEKTGGTYIILQRDATLEADATTRMVVYQSLVNGRVWVRPADEFYDGRFVHLSEREVS